MMFYINSTLFIRDICSVDIKVEEVQQDSHREAYRTGQEEDSLKLVSGFSSAGCVTTSD